MPLMARGKYQNQRDLILICDWCLQPITRAEDGNVVWMPEPDPSRAGFTHKWCDRPHQLEHDTQSSDIAPVLGALVGQLGVTAGAIGSPSGSSTGAGVIHQVTADPESSGSDTNDSTWLFYGTRDDQRSPRLVQLAESKLRVTIALVTSTDRYEAMASAALNAIRDAGHHVLWVPGEGFRVYQPKDCKVCT